jgi:anti-sigma regulatory factor (Ser/Thr protein kinase)
MEIQPLISKRPPRERRAVQCASHEVIDFEPSGFAPSLARRVVRQAVSPLVTADVAHTAELLVSELVTNAVVHGTGTVRLVIDCDDRCLSVTVSDDDPVAPRIQPERLMSEGGRGLRMIDSLAGSWGVNRRDDGTGKDVWFRLP